MVRNATTVAGVTSSLKTEYTPTLIPTSWTIAAIADNAIRHSNRQAINNETIKKKTNRALMALTVMLRPQVELTVATLTSFTVALAALANAS